MLAGIVNLAEKRHAQPISFAIVSYLRLPFSRKLSLALRLPLIRNAKSIARRLAIRMRSLEIIADDSRLL
jgi:hypothetical protein